MISAVQQRRLNENFKQVPTASWNLFRRLCHEWRLDKDDACELLQLSRLHVMGSWSLDHEMFLLPAQMNRLSYLLAAHHELQRLSADPLVIMRWLQLPRRAGHFAGQSPFVAMCRGDEQILGMVVLELMDAKNLLDLF